MTKGKKPLSLLRGKNRGPVLSRKKPVRRRPEPLPPVDYSHLDPAKLENPALYINRELSWLEFNQRVLAQVQDPNHPLLERVKFFSIVASNLDEFFMIRVATILKKFRAGIEDVTPDGMSTHLQIHAIRARAQKMMQDQRASWVRVLKPLLEEQSIYFLEPLQFTPEILAHLQEYFRKEIFPVLTPLAFDPGHPFPYISNLSLNCAVVVRHQGVEKFARVKIPGILPRFIRIPEILAGRPGHSFVFLEDVVKGNIRDLFPGTEVMENYLFRVIRDTDVVIQEDEADDLLETVDQSLKRSRYGALSLLRIEEQMPQRILDILAENFGVDESVIYKTEDRMGYGDWMALTKLHLPRLKDPPFSPRVVFDPQGTETVFDQIKRKDYLVHHPYDSFSSVESFLKAAVEDPQVVAIKITLYRIGENSPIVDQLIEAAEGGKQVSALVELKARFDEANNILWANRLEGAGVHVVYGLFNLKTHSKLCLVVRKESDGIRRYVHLGTGNYNRATAQVYTDLGLFSADPEMTDDVSEIFNFLTGYSDKTDYKKLLVAPIGLRAGFIRLVERETAHARAGRPARMVFKCNHVADPKIIQTLYQASQAGVDIDMIVRGVCCLRPDIPGISERIQVTSIVGRFLEHSRIYYFQNGGEEEIYIGSADLMERNLDRRVETLCPILDKEILEHLKNTVLYTLLADNQRAFRLFLDGHYERVQPQAGEIPLDAQQVLLEGYTGKK